MRAERARLLKVNAFERGLRRQAGHNVIAFNVWMRMVRAESLDEREQIMEQTAAYTRRVIGAAQAAFEPLVDWAHRVVRSPIWLDLHMATGGYEEDLAESHGGVEDIWV